MIRCVLWPKRGGRSVAHYRQISALRSGAARSSTEVFEVQPTAASAVPEGAVQGARPRDITGFQTEDPRIPSMHAIHVHAVPCLG